VAKAVPVVELVARCSGQVELEAVVVVAVVEVVAV
jgi:hypothetical protein